MQLICFFGFLDIIRLRPPPCSPGPHRVCMYVLRRPLVTTRVDDFGDDDDGDFLFFSSFQQEPIWFGLFKRDHPVLYLLCIQFLLLWLGSLFVFHHWQAKRFILFDEAGEITYQGTSQHILSIMLKNRWNSAIFWRETLEAAPMKKKNLKNIELMFWKKLFLNIARFFHFLCSIIQQSCKSVEEEVKYKVYIYFSNLCYFDWARSLFILFCRRICL